ncbi:hypothetical protein BDV37DRAFT_249123 [Aspergillus pseudonomiae]|uniref:Uncharacterized protein n=1 Tax=Aspergillus pseudonomiae TaxID=1506151 RepID=A0A5N7DC51_9EURO|nr:uncharacterized protein BDV37DRAFT_249123 [Aspergillus pseudonomiae]KAE8403725.1 hypothetical protein BDV37DRAFT_249123 [Aspergillus pseudonomiae]
MFTLSLHSPWAVTENMNRWCGGHDWRSASNSDNLESLDFAFLDSGKIVVEIVNLEWREPLPRCQWLRKLPNFFQDGPMGLVIRIALPIRQAVRSSSSDAQLHRTNTAIVRVQHPYLRLKEVYAWPFFQLLIGITVKDKKVSFGEIAEFTGMIISMQLQIVRIPPNSKSRPMDKST